MAPLPERVEAERLDAADPLAGFRDRFVGLDDRPYLMGNSLGPLPRATEAALAAFVRDEWGGERVRGWTHWVDLPTRVGDRLGALIGAAPGQVALGDSTSVQLYKLLGVALAARPDATTIVVADDEFATDRYVAAAVAEQTGRELRVVALDGPDAVAADAVDAACADGRAAVVLASLVRFRSAGLADLAAVTAAAHRHGALVLWDLSHAVGSVPIALDAADVDLAVGCTYKYLNAGPGAPAFAYRAARLAAVHQPIHGWFGHHDQFAMTSSYTPYADARQLLVGSPPLAGFVAVDTGLGLHEEAGVERARAVSIGLSSFALDLFDRHLVPLGFTVGSPRDPARRGAHVALEHPDAAALVAALLDRDVVVDHRPPTTIRVAAAPLHTRHVDLCTLVEELVDLLAS